MNKSIKITILILAVLVIFVILFFSQKNISSDISMNQKNVLEEFNKARGGDEGDYIVISETSGSGENIFDFQIKNSSIFSSIVGSQSGQNTSEISAISREEQMSLESETLQNDIESFNTITNQ